MVSVYVVNSLPNSEYSNLLLVAVFSFNSFPGKTSSSFKNSYLPRFSDNKAEILVVYFSKSSWDLLARFCYWLFWFFHWQQFCKSFFLNLNGLSERKFVLFTKTFFFIYNIEEASWNLQIHIRYMIHCYLLKFSLVR